MAKVGIINYGVGNLRSVTNALSELGAPHFISSDPETLLQCDRLILPGVGAFAHGMEALRSKGLANVVLAAARKETPILGICLGMQMLMEASTEFGFTEGLGLIPGQVKNFSEHALALDRQLRLPNVGWLPLRRTDNAGGLAKRMLDAIGDDASLYFVHSYAATAGEHAVAAEAVYECLPFAAMISKGNIVGTQFHPEKSGPTGLAMLQQFVN